ncbi:MAG: hypothetical protein E5Y10_24440 [Mesorhizobium sp.]|nr:MAG: hypothetical protein E5Y10_24440 [Mesorhizobium sp.]
MAAKKKVADPKADPMERIKKLWDRGERRKVKEAVSALNPSQIDAACKAIPGLSDVLTAY